MRRYIFIHKYAILILISILFTVPSAFAQEKESLVLMPVRISNVESRYLSFFESALAAGLSEKYKVIAGDQVAKKVEEIFRKEGERTEVGKDCNAEKCLQDVAIAFQTHLITMATVLKNPSGFLITLTIRDIFESTVVFSKSMPCRGCDEYQVIEVLNTVLHVKTTTAGQGMAPVKLKKSGIKGMVLIRGECYQMGDTFGEGSSNEKPTHKVCLNDFYLGEHEVTQGEWKDIMRNNPSRFISCGKDCPVEKVSWNDVQKYISKLNLKTGVNYRLPTEAEWEYAARAGGKKVKWAGTSNKSELREYAWFADNSGVKTHKVKTKKANSLGLYDMSGNVWEWVQDWYGDNYYGSSPRNNPTGSGSGSGRVFRGGGWDSDPGGLRAANRGGDAPGSRASDFGFRLARTP